MLKLKHIFFSSILLLTCSTVFGEFPEHNDYDIRGSVDMAGFLIGSDTETGDFYYIVIRTLNKCYLSSALAKRGGGLIEVDCNQIKKIPQIEAYINSGKRP